MERTQRAVVSVLLEHIFSLGLISQFTYSKAKDLVCSAMDFPDFFHLPEEEHQCECMQDPQ